MRRQSLLETDTERTARRLAEMNEEEEERLEGEVSHDALMYATYLDPVTCRQLIKQGTSKSAVENKDGEVSGSGRWEA